MGRALPATRTFKQGLWMVSLAAGLVVALPLLALVAFSLRFALLALLGAAVLALAVSPLFRRWLTSEAEAAMSYLGVRMPVDEMVSAQHAWARLEEENRVAVGVDDLAQKVLGPVEQAELPPVGAVLRQGDVLVRLRRAGRTLALRSPVAGKVAAVNERLEREPGLVNAAPFGIGWAALLEPMDLRASRRWLRRGGAARTWLRAEVDRLLVAMMPAHAVPALQDGGHLVDDLYAQIDDEGWRSIKVRFFGDEG